MAKNLKYAELRGHTRSRWFQASGADQHRLLSLPFVEKIVGSHIYFLPATPEQQIRNRVERILLQITNTTDVKYHWEAEPATDRLLTALKAPETFSSLNLGSDVAEQDDHLNEYFLSTPAYRRCKSHEKCLVIGPKGSGKTAILRTLQQGSPGVAVVITPEVFATSVLRKVVEDSREVWDESEAFVSTWIFSILVEVFKRVCEQPRGKAKALQRIRTFLADHAEYHNADIFTRFILRLKSIQALKVGPYELSIKTRKLQELYSLERLYSLIPDLRATLHDDVLVLIDELDQGWDNTPHSNSFISALVQAALKVQNLGLRLHVIAFLRSEIFDLVKHSLDQLDKLRSGIEELRWEDGQLAALVTRRLAFNCHLPPDEIEVAAIHQFFDAAIRGMSGFEYLVSRTCRRPRELLQFAREAHQIAVDDGKSRIDAATILKAEEKFSRWKFDHLCSEYKYIYPKLSELLSQFRSKGPMISIAELSELVASVRSADRERGLEWLLSPTADIIQKLYDIEFLGSERPHPKKGVPGLLANYEFAYERPAASVRRSSTFMMHPVFWEHLEVEPA